MNLIVKTSGQFLYDLQDYSVLKVVQLADGQGSKALAILNPRLLDETTGLAEQHIIAFFIGEDAGRRAERAFDRMVKSVEAAPVILTFVDLSDLDDVLSEETQERLLSAQDAAAKGRGPRARNLGKAEWFRFELAEEPDYGTISKELSKLYGREVQKIEIAGRTLGILAGCLSAKET